MRLLRLGLWLWSLSSAALTIFAAVPTTPVAATAPDLVSVYAALRRDDPTTAATQVRPLAIAGNHEAEFVLGLLLDIGAGVRLDQKQAFGWLEKSATGFAPAGQYLAWRFATGFGADNPDPAAAGRWLAQSRVEPVLEPALSRWLEFRDGRLQPKFSRAFFWMMDRAPDGDLVAQANLATAYLATQWTTPDTQQHLRWLRAAADHKDAASAERLASYYEYGILVAKDSAAARDFRQIAAEAGSVEAQFALGEQYRTGDGVAVNLVAAEKWLRLAAAQDHLAALIKLGDLLRSDSVGAAQNYPESLRFARRAVELGSTEALADVAGMLREGHGAPRDYAAAAKLYEEAAVKGHPYAADMRGWMQLQGELGEIDLADARHWFEKAAEGRNEHAMRQLGLIYSEGKGVPKDDTQAFEWFERAAREGDPWSQNRLGWMLRQGIGVERDDEEAVNWFKLAAQHGDLWGEANLGYHSLNGLGVAKDCVEGARHLVVATRGLDDPWVQQNFVQVFAAAAGPDETAALNAILQPVLSDPSLLSSAGALPEVCLLVLEGNAARFGEPGAAGKLLQAMRESRRPQSQLTVAWHAFVGQSMPYDLEVARTFAREGAMVDPRRSAVMLASIESVAADSPEVRAAASRKLRELADGGDPFAAMTLATRIFAGVEPVSSAQLAKKYLGLATGQSPEGARAAEQMLHFLENSQHVPLSEQTIAAKIVAIAATRGEGATAAPVPVSISPPGYPYDLRVSGLQGQAEVMFTVDIEGRPTDVHCTTATHPLFAYYAEAAVRLWRFAPGLKNGQPVPTKMIQPLNFQLANDPPASAAAKGSSP